MKYDLTNQKYGMLTALYPVHKDGKLFWHCRCDCGGEKDVVTYNLRTCKTWHCGCQRRPPDLTNRRFGSLVALQPAGRTGHSGPIWVARCDCGRIVEVEGNHLSGGQTTSCGCKKHKNVSGERRGHLTAIRRTLDKKNGYYIYEWRCDCGNIVFRTIRGARRDSACSDCLKKLHTEQMNAIRKSIVPDEETGLTAGVLKSIINGKPSKNNKSGVRGVYRDRESNKWIACGNVKGKQIKIGRFDDIENAKEEREQFVKETYKKSWSRSEDA